MCSTLSPSHHLAWHATGWHQLIPSGRERGRAEERERYGEKGREAERGEERATRKIREGTKNKRVRETDAE